MKSLVGGLYRILHFRENNKHQLVFGATPAQNFETQFKEEFCSILSKKTSPRIPTGFLLSGPFVPGMFPVP